MSRLQPELAPQASPQSRDGNAEISRVVPVARFPDKLARGWAQLSLG